MVPAFSFISRRLPSIFKGNHGACASVNCWGEMKLRLKFGDMISSHCLLPVMFVINVVLAVVDGLIAMVAFVQLLRIQLRNPHDGWTRQKVFHFMIGTSNLGYFIYFTLTPIAYCKEWICWSHACGFIVISLPQILFLSAFLLLLSFWVDLCHQANDKDDDEEDEDDTNFIPLPEQQSSKPISALAPGEQYTRCCPFWRRLHIRSRQKFVIVVVFLISILTIAFSVLIWIGTGRNPINSSTMAEIYSDLFAIVILMSGGGLACYGLLLYLKMSKVRYGQASADIRKVAGLAVVAVVCFTARALLVLSTDVPVLNIWHPRHVVHSQSPLLIFLYYFIGSAIPSAVVLWVLREMPPRPVDETCMRPSSTVEDSELLSDETLVQHWIIPNSGQDQIGLSEDHHHVSNIFQVRQESSR